MADLPNGTTIGGKKIIHKGIANNHRHNASDIDGLNTLATGSQGDGGGIDADVLSGNTYGDLSNEFLQVENDSISELILANHPTQNNNAVSRLYMQNSIPQNLRSGEFYGITSIGDQSTSTYDYSILDSYNIRFIEMDCLINGFKFTIPTTTIDIRDVNANFENKEFYTYIESSTNSAAIIIQEEYELNQDNKIFIGTLESNAASIESFSPITGFERVGIGRYMLSNTPKEYAIPVSDSSGKIDNSWIYGARGETLISLNGPTEISSGNTYTYSITNYNSFSNYEISPSYTGLVISFQSEDIIEVVSPSILPFETQTDLVVSKDGFENIFTLTMLADPSVTISGPTEVNSGGSNYQYTIGNYNPDYTYTVATTHGTVSRTDDIITLITPSTLENDVTATVTVSREGSSDSIDVFMLAQPPYDIVGRDNVWQSGTFTYTIDPYVSTSTYSVSASDPNVTTSFSNGTITVNVPAGTTEEYTFDLQVSSTEEGNVSRTLTVLGDPEPFNISLNGEFGANLYQLIGSPEPALNYTINVSGTLNGYETSRTVDGYILNYSLTTGQFTDGSTLTLNINNTIIYADGGHGGGKPVAGYIGSANSPNGFPGSNAIEIEVPTHLTVTNSTLRAGGGGGGAARRYMSDSGSGGKGLGSSTTLSMAAGGGGAAWGSNVGGVVSSSGNVSSTNPTVGNDFGGGSGGYSVNDEYQNDDPAQTYHGRFTGYGGNGGAAAAPGANATGSSNFEDEFSYSGSNYNTISYGGQLGTGGAAGLAINGNSNVLTFNQSNNDIIGNINI